MADAKTGKYPISFEQQQNVCEPSPCPANLNCSYCETMYKNLLHLENYLRSSTSKNSCNSCGTCLSFLLYMKQQGLPLPRFDVTKVVPGNNLPVGYAVYEKDTNPNVVEKKSVKPRTSQLKSSSVSFRSKLMAKSSSSAPSPQKLSKSQPAMPFRRRSELSGKKLLTKSVASTTNNASITAASSVAKINQSTSDRSRTSTVRKSKRTKLDSTKSTLSKAAGSKRVPKRKVNTRAVAKKVLATI